MPSEAPFSVLWKLLLCGRSDQTGPNKFAELARSIKLRYLVTGTGRSGTVSLACALTRAGISCSHERFFRGGSAEEAAGLLAEGGGGNSYCSSHCGLPEAGETVLAESSYMAAPYLAAPMLADTTIIHAVRSPWRVIPSFLNGIQFFRDEPIHDHERFIYGVLPELRHIDSPMDRAAYYYIHWNLMIEWLCARRPPAQYFLHRVEDGPDGLLRHLGTATSEPQPSARGELNSIKDWQPHMKPPPAKPIPIEEILRSKYLPELSKLAERYGYDSLPDYDADPKCQEDNSASSQAEAPSAPPLLVEAGFRGFNLVHWCSTYYGLDIKIGAIDLQTATHAVLHRLADRGACVVGRSIREVKEKVAEEVGRRAGKVMHAAG